MRIILTLLLLSSLCFAGELRKPPPQTDSALNDYLLEIQRNLHAIPITTTNPDGSKPGTQGEMVLFNNSGTYYLEICTDPANDVWLGVVLSDTP